MRTAKNKEYESFQIKTSFFYLDLFEVNKKGVYSFICFVFSNN